jgi:ubiquinone/menaquinone biosynthesis C-methylase UbiE
LASQGPAPKPRSALARYYAARAAEYDRVYEKPERQADLAALGRWLPERFADAHLLEVACGTGYWTQFVAPVATSVVAIDASPETLEIACSRPQNAAVRFRVADAYELPYDLGDFDAALAAFWFSHVPIVRRREFLSGLSAVLAPGATVVLLDNRFVPGSSTPISERDAEGDSYQLRRLSDGSEHRVRKNFPTEAELRACLADLGEGVTYTAWEYYWALEYRSRGGVLASSLVSRRPRSW